ncbi:MAG TPA: LLM class F420-dependent oxidoreductase [Dehalococcoidia bacterium]|nr:LLM class F420-dependent oxidoreductase [Dehalococcoidia bacterium]
MKFGIVMFPTDYAIDPVTLGRAVEERGFDALFFPEHTHIPTSRRTPWPGGAELPREYSHTYDPFVALAAVASATETLMLGTGICLVNQHNPITLAKLVASLDLISGGRVLFGVGAGWNIEEMENHETDYSTRFRLMRERVLAMKEIWTKDEAEYHGKLVDFDPIWSWPKPVQQPHPPVYVGGDGAHTLKRVIDYGNAWMPIPMRSETPLSERVRRLNEMAEEAGRGRIPVTVYGALPREEVIAHYADIGVERCIFWLPAAPESEAIPQLDRYGELVGSFAKAGAS